MSRQVSVGVDVGGTFTDVVLVTDSGELYTAKVPSTSDQSDGVVEGVEKACEKAGIEAADVDSFSHAMTVSVNALLEGTGGPTALVTTEGFRDVLEIGRQARPALYDMSARKPTPLVPRSHRFEVEERTTPEGVETEVNRDNLITVAEEIVDTEIESVAVCFLHSYVDPKNEKRATDILRERLDVPVIASHRVLGEFREYERASTTATGAYVTPAIDSYLERLTTRAAKRDLPEPVIMQSNGGVADIPTTRENAVTTVLSGPAAGVVGAGTAADDVARERGLDGLLSFDMGGTSSDVSLIQNGSAERTTDSEVDGRPIKVPMVDVETVGAGGGSIASVDEGGALRVGPASAGADPGPACYGNGGTQPTVTDANIVLGYIGAETALGGELELDVDAAHTVLEELADEAGLASATEAAEGVFRVANATMARAIRSVSVERGYDPRNFGLVGFGGAGPMHAAALAESLGIRDIVIPRACGVLSAHGLLGADERHDAVRTHQTVASNANWTTIETIFSELENSVREDVARTGTPDIERSADLRYQGQSFEIEVDATGLHDSDALADRFHAAHERVNGYRMDEAVEIVNLRAMATVSRDSPTVSYEATGDATLGTRQARFNGVERETAILRRRALAPERIVEGPAVLEGANSTTVVPPGWQGDIREDGALVLSGGEDE